MIRVMPIFSLRMLPGVVAEVARLQSRLIPRRLSFCKLSYGIVATLILLALLGIVLAQWPAVLGHFDWSLGIFWAVLAAFGFSLMDLLSRRDSTGADSVGANALRAWVAVAVLALVPGVLSQFLEMSLLRVAGCASAALLGPGLARVLLISASRELPAAESALLQQLLPPLALPLTSFVFGSWPTKWEWWGSAFVGAGVILPLLYTFLSGRERTVAKR